MKKYIIILMVLLFAVPAFSAVTPKQTYKRLDGNFSLPFAGTSAARDKVPSGVWVKRDGDFWYNTSTNTWYYYEGAAWNAWTGGGGTTLTGAYNYGGAGSGKTIAAESGAVEIFTTDADANPALHVKHIGAAAGDGILITVANSSQDAIEIENTGSGADIEGTGNLWSASKLGLITVKGGLTVVTGGELLVTARDVLFTGSSYDVAWDTGKDQLIFQDNAILGLGGAHDAVADWTFVGDGADLLMEAAAADDEWKLGATTNFDILIYGNSASDVITFDTSAELMHLNGFDLRIMDDDFLIFGDIVGSDSFTIGWEESGDTLDIVATTANDAVHFGDGSTNTDVQFTGATGSTYVLWDASGDELSFFLADLKINEGAQIEFVNVGDGYTDWVIHIDVDETLQFTPTEIDGTQIFAIGTVTATADFNLFGESASTVSFDASADLVTHVDYDVLYDDETILYFGTGKDFSMYSDTADTLEIDPGAAGDTLKFGTSDTDALNIIWYADVSGDTVTFDEENKMVEFEDVAIALGDQTYIIFGDTIGTGDITMGVNGTVLSIDGVVAGTGSVLIGNDDDDITFKWFAETANKYFQLTGDTAQHVGVDITMDATSELLNAAAVPEAKVLAGTPMLFEFRPTTSETLSYTVPAGYDLIVTDAWGYKIAANGQHNNDAIIIKNSNTNAIWAEFELYEGGATNDQVRFQFDTLDDAEAELEAGETLDIVAVEGTSVDCIITVIGILKIAD